MAHSCPDCGQACYCDVEDTWNDSADCLHYLSGECEGELDDEDDV